MLFLLEHWNLAAELLQIDCWLPPLLLLVFILFYTWFIHADRGVVFAWSATPPGFVFYAPSAGVERRTGYTSVCLFWAVLRSSEFGELSSL